MTIKEFAEKHKVPYYLAYKASYKVHPVATFRRDREYVEEDLLEETIRYVGRMASSYRKKADLYDSIIRNLKT